MTLESDKQLNEEIKIGDVEKSMMILGFSSVALLIATHLLFYYAFASKVGVTLNYFQYVLYLTISIVFIGTSAWYVKHHRKELNCSATMMVGMIIGMISGFLLGAIVAA